MPDIRNFFGGGGPAKGPSPKKATEPPKTKKARGRKVVSDDDEEEVIEQKPKKPVISKKKQDVKEPKVEETTSSEYFAKSAKDKKEPATPVRSKTAATNGNTRKQSNGATPSSARRSARKTATKTYAEDDGEDLDLKDEDEGRGDIFADDAKGRSRRGRDDYEEDSDEDDKPLPRTSTSTNGRAKKAIVHDDEDEDDDVEMAELPAYDGPSDSKKKKPTSIAKPASRKRKSKDMDDDDGDDVDEEEVPKKKSRTSVAKTTPKKPRANTKKEPEAEDPATEAILKSIPTVRAPTPPPRGDDEKRKFQFGGGNTSVVPAGAGTFERPVGAENCLAGLTFVFTGVLPKLGREEGQNLVKEYGGKVTTAPSKNTKFVVLGSDAGPKKLETIRNLNLTTIGEEGLCKLIRELPANGGSGAAAAKHAEKQAEQEAKIQKEAEEMERREKEKAKAAVAAARNAGASSSKGSAPATAKRPPPKPSEMLWVDRYAPDAITSVCGNKGLVEGLQNWLRKWHQNARFGFKKAGADGKGIFRAAMLYGPPGVGKTTAAHLVAKLEGFDVLESNASDTRSKKLVEAGLTGVLDSTSIMGYFAGDGKKVEASHKKLVLIMDEVDGMSAGDRGGVGAMAKVAKATKVPLILICNDRRLPKMKPFDFVCAEFQFRRPTVDQVRARIMTICYREGMRLPAQIVNALIEGTNADIRQTINMLSTIKIDNKDMDFSDTKAMSKAWEKHVILKPWDVVSKILRPELFSEASKATLNEKIELYFNDHEFSYLMLQENYLKTQPSLANSYSKPKERNLKLLELADKAASSISDGDLVDRMIHGSQQQWSLMPTHAVFSFVRPASYIYGNFNAQVRFAEWLGQNSKYGKLLRFVKDIQGHMRLKSSGDRHEVRQQYFSALWEQTVGRLSKEGKDSVQDVIDFMDSYYLTRDDFDSLAELGVGPMGSDAADGSNIKIDSQTKAAFTRSYNSQSHPMPFIKASNLLGVAKVAGKAKPDLEEAIDESEGEDGMLDADAKDDEAENEELDLKKDKYVKVPKKKAAPKAKAAGGGGKGKRKKGDDEDEETAVEEEDVKPKKKAADGRKGKGKA